MKIFLLRKRFSFLIVALILGGLCATVWADSPLTSTDFHKQYLDVPMVQAAQKASKLDSAMMEFFSEDSNPVDVKVAIINAIGWKFDGQNNAGVYSSFLEKKYGSKGKAMYGKMTRDELLCLGYLTAMDDYFDVNPALPILRRAAAKNSRSFTVAIIYALTKAQNVDDYKAIWKATEKVLTNKNFKKDMRPKAVEAIVSYMKLYQE